MAVLPAKVIGAYWPSWSGPALPTLSPSYNTLWLFAATPVGGTPGSTGAVEWSQQREGATQFNSDLAKFRASGKCAILSVGGAGSYIRIDTQARAEAFIASIERIYTQLGGFDGIDVDIEGGVVWATQFVYIARKLKSIYGSSFAITFCPAPWSGQDRTTCAVMYNAGVLDLVSPQFYELSGLFGELSKISNLVGSIDSIWLPLVGNEAHRIGLGYGIVSSVSETMTLESLRTAWQQLVVEHPTIRGAFCWEAHADAASGYSFANTMSALIGNTGTTPSPTARTYTVVSGDTLSKIGTKFGVNWQLIASANGIVSPYTIQIGQVLIIPS